MMDAGIFQYKTLFRRKQLEGILTDCIAVYKIMLAEGKQLNNKENDIRDELTKYFQDDLFIENHTTAVKYFHVDTEIREGEHGRIDIRFLKVKPYETPSTYFTIECKRLDGGMSLNKKYVKEGIFRFTTLAKYKTTLGYNAMMGFMVKRFDIVGACDSINGQLADGEQLSTVISNETEGYHKFESSHQNNIGTFTLFHLWLDFSACIKQ